MTDYEIENKELDEVNFSFGTCVVIMVGVAAAVSIPLIAYNSIKNNNNINWDTLKKSSIVITKDDKLTNYHIINKDENNMYYDIINNYDINPDTIVYTIDTASYLVNIDGVKDSYSKEELKEILKQFSMNQEYTVSDETIKVLVKEK